MAEKASEVIADYLRDLNDALLGIDDDVRRDLVNGAREELQGLDPDTARQRIVALGDPAFIAAEANDSSARSDTEPAVTATRYGRGYAVTATLLFALGGIVIPILGWLAGLFMVLISRQWWNWEKLLASLVVPAVGLLAWLFVMVSPEPARGDPTNPLMPNFFDVWWSSALLAMAGNFVAGMWLLWRSRRDPRPREREKASR